MHNGGFHSPSPLFQLVPSPLGYCPRVCSPTYSMGAPHSCSRFDAKRSCSYRTRFKIRIDLLNINAVPLCLPFLSPSTQCLTGRLRAPWLLGVSWFYTLDDARSRIEGLTHCPPDLLGCHGLGMLSGSTQVLHGLHIRSGQNYTVGDNMFSSTCSTQSDIRTGDLVYSRLLGKDIIIINSEMVAKELLENRSKNCSDRPYLITIKLLGLRFLSSR